MKCPQCHRETPDDSKFCKECGYSLANIECQEQGLVSVVSERKQVTVLFSDLSGYTAMTKRLDPEEVKAIMSDIFADITRIITKYEGHIERFIGDAVMAVFGMPIAHELDPVRALRATIEIHELVASLSPQYEGIIGHSLTMHSGLNSGLVVTGEVDLKKGTHGITGDSVNTAARIQGLAKSNEILVGQETFQRTEGYFEFEVQSPHTVKNKSKPLYTYKLISRKDTPDKVHRISGLRAKLIGREAEMGILKNALANLKKGQGAVISIFGDPGTGKSRLVSEFKATLDKDAIQWREGHAYGYTQSIPYYPLVNLLSHAFQIGEEDPLSTIREKAEKGVAYVMGPDRKIVPYLGSLFSIDYPEIAQISPDLWKSRLHASIQSIVSHMSKARPTVICIEDLHWADASFVDLLRDLVVSTVDRVLFICVYRAFYRLFDEKAINELAEVHHPIQLEALSALDTRQMLKSLLQTQQLPAELNDFIQQKSDGNPFYLEELVNSLIDTGCLKIDHEGCHIQYKLKEIKLPSSIQGVLAARIDCLDKSTKKFLQEASVIGRAFPHKLIKQITKSKSSPDKHLKILKNLDLIRVQSTESELEFIFKHALIQEVVYRGLLNKERQKIHKRIGHVMEYFYHYRLQEFYEIIAFHFEQGQSVYKAVEYLIKARKKNFSKCSVDVSIHFYEKAFELLSHRMNKGKNEATLLIDLLNEWGFALLWNGSYSVLINLFKPYETLANGINDKKKARVVF